MRSTAIPVGNLNMRGKRTKLLRCGCCTAMDLRHEARVRSAKREIARAAIAKAEQS